MSLAQILGAPLSWLVVASGETNPAPVPTDGGSGDPTSFLGFLAEPLRGLDPAIASKAAPSIFDWPLIETLLLLLVAGGVAWLVARGWSRGLRFLWSSGLDKRRRLAHTVPPLRLFLALIVISVALSPLEFGSSLTSAALLGGGLALVAIVGHAYLRDVVGGIAIAMRRPFTIGDPVGVDGLTGRVIDIGLTRVRLETPDGGRVDVPARNLAAGRVTTSNGRRALPTEVIVRIRGEADSHRIQSELRDQVFFSAYVDAAAPVIVEALGDGTVRIQATPLHADDADELRSDLTARAATLAMR